MTPVFLNLLANCRGMLRMHGSFIGISIHGADKRKALPSPPQTFRYQPHLADWESSKMLSF